MRSVTDTHAKEIPDRMTAMKQALRRFPDPVIGRLYSHGLIAPVRSMVGSGGPLKGSIGSITEYGRGVLEDLDSADV